MMMSSQAMAGSKVRTSKAQAERYQTAFPQYGLGIASVNGFIPVSTLGTSLSGLIAFSRDFTVQAYLTMGSTSPFTFGAGGIAKYTVSGSNYSGFHVGGGVVLGTTGVFFASIPFVAGAHFAIPSLRNLMFSFDAGPRILIQNSTVNFSIDSLSSVLGLSVHYMF